MINQNTLRNYLPAQLFEIPKIIIQKGTDFQINTLFTSCKLGDSSFVIVYDNLSLEETLSKIKSKIGGLFHECYDFAYKQTIGKSTGSNHLKTRGLLSHLFTSQETDYTEKTLILYHTFTGLTQGVLRILEGTSLAISLPEYLERENIVAYLDGACGRGWSHAHSFLDSSRLPRFRKPAPLIYSGLVMSTDEKAANNWFVSKKTSCTRAHIGTDFPVYFIF
jgi:hypothetical protein